MISPRQAIPITELLETRWLLAFSPSGQEQEALELINRMRQNPRAELAILLKAGNHDVENALRSFNVNRRTLARQFAQLSPVPPLNWSEQLYKAAVDHTQQMKLADQQSHQLPGEAGLRQRASNKGYTANSYLAENVFAYVTSVFQAHAGFAVDWGNGPSGIQNPPGHRDSIMDENLTEAGISIQPAKHGARETGPFLTSQEFGGPVDRENAYLLGTVRKEKDNDHCYDAGEGLGGIRVQIVGAGHSYETTTMASGAYQVPVEPGEYTVTVGGISRSVEVEEENVKQDFVVVPDNQAPRATISSLANVIFAGATSYIFNVTYTDNVGLNVSSLGNDDVVIDGRNGHTPASLITSTINGNGSVTATYRYSPPGGSWDKADNGRYQVRVLAGGVKDLAGNGVRAGEFSKFDVNIRVGTNSRNREGDRDVESRSPSGKKVTEKKDFVLLAMFSDRMIRA